MGTTPGAQQNLTNTMLALARLDELHNANIVNQAAKQESIRKRQEDVMAQQEKARQTGLTTQTQQLFGTEQAAAAAPWTQNLSRAYTRGAEAPTEIPAATPEETTPGGFKIPSTGGTALRGLVSRGTIEQMGQQAQQQAREEGIREYLTVYGGTPEGDVVRDLRERAIPILPGAPMKAHLANVFGIEKEKAGVLQAHRAAQKATTEAALAERTLEPSVTKAQEEAAQAVIGTRVARYKEAFQPLMDEQDLALKTAQAALEREKVSQIPAARQKAAADLQHVLAQNANLRLDYATKLKTQQLIEAVQRAQPGTPEWQKLGGQLATQQGHHYQWFVEAPLLTQQAYVNASNKVADYDIEIAKQAGAGNIETVQNIVPLRNSMALATSRMLNSPYTAVTSVALQPGGWLGMGKGTAAVGTTMAPTSVVEALNSGNLEKAMYGKAIVPNPVNNNAPMKIPEAVEAWVRLKNIHARGDSKTYADAISKVQGVSQQDLAAALQLLMKQNPAYVNVSEIYGPPTPPAPPVTGSINLDVGEEEKAVQRSRILRGLTRQTTEIGVMP